MIVELVAGAVMAVAVAVPVEAAAETAVFVVEVVEPQLVEPVHQFHLRFPPSPPDLVKIDLPPHPFDHQFDPPFGFE